MCVCSYITNYTTADLLLQGASTRSFGTTVQQCQKWVERGQAGQAMAWALPDHRTHLEGSVLTV